MAKDHAPGEWEVGSGRVRQRESALEAVVREAREETGLEVQIVRPLDTFQEAECSKYAFLSWERLQHSTECSVRKNIESFLQKILLLRVDQVIE